MNKTILLDGAIGSTLLKRLKLPLQPAISLNQTHLTEVQKLHEDYLDVGSKVIGTNTFAGDEFSLQKLGISYSQQNLFNRAIKAADLARKKINPQAQIAGIIGPVDISSQYNSNQMVEAYQQQINHFLRDEIDLMVFETQYCFEQIKLLLEALKFSQSTKPFVISLTLNFEAKLNDQTPLSKVVSQIKMSNLQPMALGFNCSYGPASIIPAFYQLQNIWSGPIWIKPSLGIPDSNNDAYPISSQNFIKWMLKYSELGAIYLGGCCGTGPSEIRKLKTFL